MDSSSETTISNLDKKVEEGFQYVCSQLSDVLIRLDALTEESKAMKQLLLDNSISIPTPTKRLEYNGSSSSRLFGDSKKGDVQFQFPSNLSDGESMKELESMAYVPDQNYYSRKLSFPPDAEVKNVMFWVGSFNMGAKEAFDEKLIHDPEALKNHLHEFVPLGYDFYVLGIQEGISDQFYEAVAAYTGCARVPITLAAYKNRKGKPRNREVFTANVSESNESELAFEDSIDLVKTDRVEGRGDGSFLYPKFTGIAVFVSASIAEHVSVLGLHRHGFGAGEGSKGGVGVALRVYDASIVFVNCHLASKKIKIRMEQYMELCKYLGKLGNPNFHLNEQFHHVVWMGDLNYRCSGVNGSTAGEMMSSGKMWDLFEKYDDLLLAKRKFETFFNYQEPIMAPDFNPTYKKIEGRGGLDMSKPGWVDDQYRIQFKEPFYKGGRMKERVPGWCDRIQYHSMESTRGRLQPEVIKSPEGDHHNYKTVHSTLVTSDHSPVFSTFSLDVDANKFNTINDPCSPQSVIVIRLTDLRVEDKAQLLMPKRVKIMYPAPFECGDATPDITDVDLEKSASVDVSVTWTGPLAALPGSHLLLCVYYVKNVKAFCNVELKGLDSSSTTTSSTYLCPLFSQGQPWVTSRGNPIHAQFTVTASTFNASMDVSKTKQPSPGGKRSSYSIDEDSD